MFNLVDAVGKTSVTLSVKERIAQGLSRAGTSNTLKVVFYNAILGVIAAFSEGAVRQFCAFALVVLVAHWFLAHTFFMAVLSIDLARVEVIIAPLDFGHIINNCLVGGTSSPRYWPCAFSALIGDSERERFTKAQTTSDKLAETRVHSQEPSQG